MLRSRRGRRRAGTAPPEINVIPLIDVVFFLLVFFLMTTSFIRDTGVRIEKPGSVLSEALEPQALRVGVTAEGAIYVDGERLDLRGLRERVGAFVARERRGSVILVPDERLPSGRLVAVMDATRLGGASDVAVATRAAEREEEP